MTAAIAQIGHNRPPSAIDHAPDAMTALSDWMAEYPVIQSEEHAREAKALLDRAKGCAGDIEAERDSKVRPLNEQIASINSEYKSVHNTDSKKPGTLDKIVNELKLRLTDFVKAEEARRVREADEKRRAAEAAEQAAREAEQREREAIENARNGELGVDVTQVVVEADSRFATFKKADREAARADRDTHVRIGGGFGRAVSLRTVETLILDDPIQAIRAVGVNEAIRDAILSAARDYRKQNGKLPAGVSSATTRHV